MHDLDVHTEGLVRSARRIPRHKAETRRGVKPYSRRGLMILALALAAWGVVLAFYYIIGLYL
ncbi:hypothetical protein FF80_03263 [Devosia sp. LC5]|nr:hypothetical protein FF80_03263 [Devosia sp. LC5]